MEFTLSFTREELSVMKSALESFPVYTMYWTVANDALDKIKSAVFQLPERILTEIHLVIIPKGKTLFESNHIYEDLIMCESDAKRIAEENPDKDVQIHLIRNGKTKIYKTYNH